MKNYVWKVLKQTTDSGHDWRVVDHLFKSLLMKKPTLLYTASMVINWKTFLESATL